MKNTLYLVIPCYNEELVLEETTKRLNEKFEQLIKNNIISKKSKVLYVNDGSKDKSLSVLKKYQKKDKRIRVINQKNIGLL